jgi:hypothetical protein
MWKHKNDCVFNGVSPSLATARDKSNLWCTAGAKALMSLAGQGSDGDKVHLVIVVG